MIKKSLVWQILSFMVAMIAGYSGLFDEKTQMVLGIISFSVTALLQSPILSTGTFPKGWDSVMWFTQIAGVLIQVVNFLGEKAVVPAMFVNMFIFTVNTIIVTFVKNYNTNN